MAVLVGVSVVVVVEVIFVIFRDVIVVIVLKVIVYVPWCINSSSISFVIVVNV